jgi:hypothetical protein
MTAGTARFGWQVLHGLSQCAFQANAATGAALVADMPLSES